MKRLVTFFLTALIVSVCLHARNYLLNTSVNEAFVTDNPFNNLILMEYGKQNSMSSNDASVKLDYTDDIGNGVRLFHVKVSFSHDFPVNGYNCTITLPDDCTLVDGKFTYTNSDFYQLMDVTHHLTVSTSSEANKYYLSCEFYSRQGNYTTSAGTHSAFEFDISVRQHIESVKLVFSDMDVYGLEEDGITSIHHYLDDCIFELRTKEKGDVNTDNKIDISDIVAIINHIAGTGNYYHSDVNGDNKVDISDIVAVINIIASGASGSSQNETDAAVEAGLCPDTHHPHAIDLGDGVKWACCNVGASAPWEYGGYYAWGETEEKSNYEFDSYAYRNGNDCLNIGSNIAGTNYDVAHVKWGGAWNMPNVTQIKALFNKSTGQWISINGVNGWKFTGNNGRSIFLPAAGVDNGLGNFSERWGVYWSSSQYPDYSGGAWALDFDDGWMNPNYIKLYPELVPSSRVESHGRHGGNSVRPVMK